MLKLFDETRSYVLGDPELSLIGDREKLEAGEDNGLCG